MSCNSTGGGGGAAMMANIGSETVLAGAAKNTGKKTVQTKGMNAQISKKLETALAAGASVQIQAALKAAPVGSQITLTAKTTPKLSNAQTPVMQLVTYGGVPTGAQSSINTATFTKEASGNWRQVTRDKTGKSIATYAPTDAEFTSYEMKDMYNLLSK